MEIGSIIFLFFIGLFLLVFSADRLVKGASSLARNLDVSEIVIGLTIVAFGTSTPELVVNVFASLRGNNEIVFGNVIGSNIFNILVILGISGLIYPLTIEKNTVLREIPFSFLAVFLLFILVNIDGYFGDGNFLSRFDGVIFLACFALFIVYIFGISKVHSSGKYTTKTMRMGFSIANIVFGFAGLFIGGRLLVDNAISLARVLSVSEKVIALTIVAAGTSLPELATSTVAAFRKDSDIAIGNIVGSNIFNIFFILGASSLIHPARFDTSMNVDIIVLASASLLLFLIAFTGRKRRLDRWEAFLFLAIFIAYFIFIIVRK